MFDFDGVICDSFEPTILLLSSISEKYGFKSPSIIDFIQLRQLETLDIFASFGIDKAELPTIIVQLLEAFSLQIDSLKIVHGMQEVVREFYKNNIKMGIVTSNSDHNVTRFLNNHKINYFDFIHSGAFFNKGEILKKIIKEENHDPQTTFYVGDESRDIVASREANLCSVSATWGFNAETVLARHSPDYIINSPKELIPLVLGNITKMQ